MENTSSLDIPPLWMENTFYLPHKSILLPETDSRKRNYLDEI